jgi:hypothetical protein
VSPKVQRLCVTDVACRVNKTLGAMTGLTFDGIDVLGPVSGRIGMGYFDCFCTCLAVFPMGLR